MKFFFSYFIRHETQVTFLETFYFAQQMTSIQKPNIYITATKRKIEKRKGNDNIFCSYETVKTMNYEFKKCGDIMSIVLYEHNKVFSVLLTKFFFLSK